MEDLLDDLDFKADKPDSMDLSSITHYMENNFVSKVTFSGTPILPPLMTRRRKEEMLMYKRQACLAETRVNASRRERNITQAKTFIKQIQKPSQREDEAKSQLTTENTALKQNNRRHEFDDYTEDVPKQETNRDSVMSDQSKTVSEHNTLLSAGGSNVPSKSREADKTSSGTNQPELEAVGQSFSTDQHSGLLSESGPGSLHLEAGMGSLEEPGIPSFLQSMSDYQSLDDEGSLPTEYDGLPLTSTKEKQINQLLAKLSRDLKLRDSLTSTSNSSNSDGFTNQSQTPSLMFSTVTSERGDNYFNMTSNNTSQGTIVESSVDEVAINNLADMSSSTMKSNTLGNLSADELSLENKSNDSIKSPKSLKNTVHFASTVTEIYTDKTSGQSSTLQKSLHSPASTQRTSEAALAISQTSENLLHNLKARRNDTANCIASNPDHTVNVATENHTPQPQSKSSHSSGSMLSKVSLSPDMDSPMNSKDTQTIHKQVPFQSYTIEGETSDKENECLLTMGSKTSPRSQILCHYNDQSLEPKELREKKKVSPQVEDVRPAKVSPQVEDVRPAKSTDNIEITSSRPGSQLSKVNLQFVSTDTDTLCGSESVQRSQEVYTSPVTDQAPADNETTLSTVLPTQHMNIPLNEPEASKNNKDRPDNVLTLSKEHSESNNRHTVDGFKKQHARKGSYTLEAPSPALVRACSQQNIIAKGNSDSNEASGNANKGNISQTNAGLGTSERVQKQLDYSELDDEPTRGSPVTQVEIDAERRGKEEHLSRYLDCVQRQSEESEQRSRSSYQSSAQMSHNNPLTSLEDLSTISSSLFDQNKLTHLSQEDMFNLQASHFDFLRKELVEQQKSQLEHLFQQQQQQQLLLQREIEERCRAISEQQNRIVNRSSSGQQVLANRQQAVVNCSDSSQQAIFNRSGSSQQIPDNRSGISRQTAVNSSGGGQRHSSQNNIPISRNSPVEPSAGNSTNSYSYVSSPSLMKHPADKDMSIISTFSRTTPKQYLFSGSASPQQQTNQIHQSKPVLRSPRQAQPSRPTNRRMTIPDQVNQGRMKRCFDRLSAVVKGYLTRRLLRTEKVQNLIKTVQDTRDFAINFQRETPIKQGRVSLQDQTLLDRIIAQLQAALLDIHEVFFEISNSERMSMIAASRHLVQDRRFKEMEQHVDRSQRRVSTATLKAIERKKRAQAAEASVFGATTRRSQSTPPPDTSSPKTARSMDLRALRPLQGQISPIRPGQDDITARESKERPKTAPDRVTVSKVHKLARKTSLTAHGGEQQRRPSKSVLVKAKPSTSNTTTTTTATTKPASKPTLKNKSDKAWR